MITTTWPDEKEGNHCGSPFGCTLLKLADVPELDYYADKGKGEIMVKGPHVTQGYFKVCIHPIQINFNKFSNIE